MPNREDRACDRSAAACASVSTASVRSTASTSPFPRARSTAFSAPTAPARRRRCGCCSASSIPTRATARLLGHDRPLEAAHIVGYLPEERGLYPAMKTRDAIAFMGALRGLPLDVGRKRAVGLLTDNGLGDYVDKPIRSLSKGMAQTVQLFGTIVHRPEADRARRALLRPRRDQPGPARTSDPRGSARTARPSSSRPMSSPMPSGCANGSRSSPAASSASKARSPTRASGCARRCGCGPAPPTARGAGRCRPTPKHRDGVWHFELAGRRCRAAAQGADRRRRRHRGIVDRAAGPARRLRRDRRPDGGARDGGQNAAEDIGAAA